MYIHLETVHDVGERGVNGESLKRPFCALQPTGAIEEHYLS